MPGFRVNVSVQTKGAIFSASASKAAGQRAVVSMNDLLAQEGVNRVRAHLGQVLQNPTGFYESHISVERKTQYRGVWDEGVVYGGWLEGVDPRNRTTRFKGYRTFRLVRQSLNQDKYTITQRAIVDYVRELNK